MTTNFHKDHPETLRMHLLLAGQVATRVSELRRTHWHLSANSQSARMPRYINAVKTVWPGVQRGG